MDFSFISLGTASALPTVDRYPSAHVLNIRGRLFLIDCGEGCQMLLKKHDISIMKIDRIFISHLHGDHVFGLFGLFSSLSMMGRRADLHIYSPERMDVMIDFFIKEFGEGIQYNIVFHLLDSLEPTIIFESKSIEVLSFPLNHRVSTYGYIFREKEPSLNVYKELIEPNNITLKEIAELKRGENLVRKDGTILESSKYTYKPYKPRSFAYCCDTAPFDALDKWIKDVDLLYHEATFAKDLELLAATTSHSTTEQTAMLAKKAGVKKLIIGHFSSRYTDLGKLLKEVEAVFPNVEIAEMGKIFSIDLNK